MLLALRPTRTRWKTSEWSTGDHAITVVQRVEPNVEVVRQLGAVNRPVSQADDDGHLVRLWLHGKSANTRDAYERDVRAFVDFADVPLGRLTLGHLQSWSDALEGAGLAASTRSRKLSAVKSLLSFGHKVGYLTYNVGAAVGLPKQKDTLAERILPEAAVHRVLAVADAAAEGGSFVQLRNALALRLFYASGGRVSEIAGLCWRDCVERSLERGRPTGQVTLYGKGGKTRRVLLSADTWAVLDAHRQREMAGGYAVADGPVLRSRKADAEGSARPLTRQQLWRVVKDLAKRAGLTGRRFAPLLPPRSREPRPRPRRPAPPRPADARPRESPDDLEIRPRPARRFFSTIPRGLTPPPAWRHLKS